MVTTTAAKKMVDPDEKHAQECSVCYLRQRGNLIQVPTKPEYEGIVIRWVKKLVDPNDIPMYIDPQISDIQDGDYGHVQECYLLQIIVPYKPADIRHLEEAVRLPEFIEAKLWAFLRENPPDNLSTPKYDMQADDLYRLPTPQDSKESRVIPISIVLPIPAGVIADTAYNWIPEIIPEFREALVIQIRMYQVARFSL